MDKQNGKAKIWMYAVVLFTSAFIVLLLTAYSQIKFNKNINEYRNQIYSKENEKNNFQINLNTALEDNMKLNNDFKLLEAELSKISAKLEEYKQENSDLQTKSKNALDTYENLLLAEKKYNERDYSGSAEILKQKTDSTFLSGNGLDKYLYLTGKAYSKAALKLYSEGCRYYKGKMYPEAIDSFNKSLEYASDEYYSDDCYYFLAYSEYMQSNMEEARTYVNMLLEKYPDTNYEDNARGLLKMIGS